MRWSSLALWLLIGACGGGNPSGGGDGGGGDDGPGGGDGPLSCPPGQWCVETAPVTGTLLHAVYAASANDVFVVGDAGTILHRRDNAWTQMTSNLTENLRGVGGTSAGDV